MNITLNGEITINTNDIFKFNKCHNVTCNDKITVNSNGKFIVDNCDNVTFNDDITVNYTKNYGSPEVDTETDMTFYGIGDVSINKVLNILGYVTFWGNNVQLGPDTGISVSGKLFGGSETHFRGSSNSYIVYDSNFVGGYWDNTIMGPNITVYFNEIATFDSSSIVFQKNTNIGFYGNTNFNISSTSILGEDGPCYVTFFDNCINSSDELSFGNESIVNFNELTTFNNGSECAFGRDSDVEFNGKTTFNTGSTCTFGNHSHIEFFDDVNIYGSVDWGDSSTVIFHLEANFDDDSEVFAGTNTHVYFYGNTIHGGFFDFEANSVAYYDAPVTYVDSTHCTYLTNATVILNDYCTVDSGATVYYDRNSLFFHDSLVVYGKLWADNCTIDFSDDTTKAQGIIFEGAGASLSRITDCIIVHCVDGITIKNSCPLIKTTEIYDTEKRGINITGVDAEPEIRQCYIHTNGTYPLQVLNGANPTLVDNRFYGNGKCGARIWGADGVFSRNEFRSNIESGVFIFSSTSAPQFYSFADSGGNMFDMSHIATQAVYIGGGTPLFGCNSFGVTGNNTFKNRGSRYYIYNDTDNEIDLELNWWPDGTPTSAFYNAPPDGETDISPKLDTEPHSGPLLLKVAVSPYNTGFEKYQQKDYAGAMEDLKQNLQQDKTSLEAAQAVFHLGKAARKIGRLGELESFLGDLKKEKDPKIQYHSRNWLCYLYASRNDMKNAEKLLNEVPKGSSLERTMLLDICSYYASWKDMKNAERIAGILRERHNNEVLEMELEAALEGWIDFNQVKGQTKARRRVASTPISVPDVPVVEKTLAPTDTVAFKAGIYPNPFNSSTTINFGVEKDGPVQIAIYDLLGRCVQTLMVDRRVAGSYRAVWNGCDNTGRSVASGIYFVRMQTGNKVQSFKISYVK